jgi:hypothetical protein
VGIGTPVQTLVVAFTSRHKDGTSTVERLAAVGCCLARIAQIRAAWWITSFVMLAAMVEPVRVVKVSVTVLVQPSITARFTARDTIRSASEASAGCDVGSW